MKPIIQNVRPFDERTHCLDTYVDADMGDYVLRTWDVRPLTLGEAKAAAMARLAARRWERETAGIIVNDVPVDTNREPRNSLIGAALAATLAAAAGELYTVVWKTPEGPQPLDGAVVIAIARAAEGYVRECYRYEADLIGMIAAAATIADVLGIDISSGWPERLL